MTRPAPPVERGSEGVDPGEKTERRRAFRELFDDTPLMLLGVDASGRIAAVNRRACDTLGLPRRELLGQSLRRFQSAAAFEESEFRLERILGAAEPAEWGTRLEVASGQWLDMDISGHRIRMVNQDWIALLACVDVTERNRLQAEMRHQLDHDVLTGLLNRSGLLRSLEDRLAGSREADYLFHVNVDFFRYINQVSGYAEGDAALRTAARLIRDRVADGDALLGRIGADEFLLVQRGRDDSAAIATAEHIIAALGQVALNAGDVDLRLSASVGVAGTRPDVAAAELLSNAASACFDAKRSARGSTRVYVGGLEAESDVRGVLLAAQEVRQALNDEAVMVFAQPIYAAANTDVPKSFELLARIEQHGRAGFPPALLQASERFGLMDSLDRYMVSAALTWLEDNPAIADRIEHLAVNLSGNSVSEPSFGEFLMHRIQQSDVPPHKLCFEITETTAVANLAQAQAMIRSLRAIGCKFSLDDFGAGMCSFAYLRDIDVDFVKIDGSFVQNIDQDPVCEQIVSAVNQTAKVLGKSTIAEFVDNPESLALLRQLGVDEVQGWLFSPAVPIDEVHALFPAVPASLSESA